MPETILVFQDKLGITAGYESAWQDLLNYGGLDKFHVRRFSSYNSVLKNRGLLIQKGNRKAPGFNPDIISEVRHWFETHVDSFKPPAVLMMDPALFGLIEPNWNAATTDNLRGGVYPYKTRFGHKTWVVVTVPISAIHRRMDPKEVAALNQGAYSKSEWSELQAMRKARDEEEGVEHDDLEDERDPEEFFIPPYKIPYGRFVLRVDLSKLRRAATGQLRPWPRNRYTLVDDMDIATRCLDSLSKAILISSDTETHPVISKKGTKPMAHMTCVGYTGLMPDGTTETFVLPFTAGKSAHAGLHHFCLENLELAQKINALPIPFTFQNGPYDLAYFIRDGMPIEDYAYDSMTMFWSLWPELPKRLEFITSILSDSYRYWKSDRKSDSIEEYWAYCGKDCYTTLCNTLELIGLLTENQRARTNFIEAHLRVCVFLAMSMRGMNADENRLEHHRKTLMEARDAEETRLRYLVADPTFNVNSPKQKNHLIYTLMGARPRNAKGKFVKRIEEGSTGATVLRVIQHEHPIFRRIVKQIIAVSEPGKQISNLIEGTKRRDVARGRSRFFTAYDGVGTTTTRASSRQTPFYDGGNAQNIRKTYRDFIISDEDSIQLDVDFSAADDVYVSFESGDQKKIDLFRSGRDTHAVNAVLFFDNWTYESVIAGKKAEDERVVHPIRGIRQITKKLGHGCNYLMAGLTLLLTAGRDAIVAAAKELGHEDAGFWTQDRLVAFCGILETKYRNHYTRFKRHGGWYDDIVEELKRDRGVTTAFGYFQRFLGSPKDDDVLRAAAATMGQANTAGRINDAIIELDLGRIRPRFRDGPNPHSSREPLPISRKSYGISIRLQTHDSLTFNVGLKHPRWQEGCERIIEVMRRPTVIRNKTTGVLEEFACGIEAELGIRWGKGMTPWNGKIDSLESAVIQAQVKHSTGGNK